MICNYAPTDGDLYVAIGYDANGNSKAFECGGIAIAVSAAQRYKRKKRKGVYTYPTVKVMPYIEWMTGKYLTLDNCNK